MLCLQARHQLSRGCLGRLQISADTTGVLAADTTDVLPADTTHVLPADNPGFLWKNQKAVEGSEKLQPKSWDLGEKEVESFHGRMDFIMKHVVITRDSI